MRTELRTISGGFLKRSRSAQATWVAALILTALLLAIPEIIRLDGRSHADWLQFVGRFHPLAVHLPIGLIVLLPVLEFAGAFRPALREAARFVLGLAFAAAVGSLVLGYFLAYGGGDSGATVTRHIWGGIVLCIGLMLCWLARPSWLKGQTSRLYPCALASVILTLLWTAHQGGSLAHGSNYLTEYMPAPLKRWVAPSTVNAAYPDSFYARRIHPILDSNCIACHGASKTEGGLRVDSYELLMKGGKDGPVISPHSAEKSILLERVTLPADNKHFMPAEGRPPLKPDEIASIRAWIQQGASPSTGTIAGIATPEQPKDLPPQPVGDYSKWMDEIRRMQQAQGAKLLPVSSKASDGLILNTVDVASGFDDTQLAQLEKFGPYIVEANLARTAVTDASFEVLSRFVHLRALHLEGTAVTGNGLTRLTPLSQLTYLNLSDTKVTAAALEALKTMPNLRHVYLFNTPAHPAPVPEAAQATADAAQPAKRSAQ
jgi:mono/diheme cytochrome c family protein